MTTLAVVAGMGVAVTLGCGSRPGDADLERLPGAPPGPVATAPGGGGRPAAEARHPQDRITHPVAFPQYPSLSPDGSVIVFAHAGDLWSVPTGGGIARRLTAHPAEEGRSAFSPDGSMLAFESERDGTRNLYVMPLGRDAGGELVGGPVRRVTISDRPQTLAGFSPDGQYVLFASTHEPGIHRASRMYRAAVDAPESGGALMERLTDAYGAGPRFTPDGQSLIFHRGRFDPARPRYTGSANADLYRLDVPSGRFTRLTTDPRHDGEGFPLPDGSIVFLSARDGQFNIWKIQEGAIDAHPGALQQLTRFAPTETEQSIGHGVRDLNVSANGALAVFCVWDALYTLDLRATVPAPERVNVVAGGDFIPAPTERINVSRLVTEAALSPDGRTVALVARGEVFVRSTEKDHPARRVTGPGPAGQARASDLAWSPDGRMLLFVSDMSGVPGVYAATVALARDELAQEPVTPAAGTGPPSAGDSPDQTQPAETRDSVGARASPGRTPADPGARWTRAVTFSVTPLAVGEVPQYQPVPSPDGSRLLITRGLGDLVVFELAPPDPDQEPQAGPRLIGDGRVIVRAWNPPDALWAPDSRHVIYAVEDVYYNSDIWLIDALADTPAPVNLTRHPDADHSPRLSADGKVLYFLSDRDAAVNGQDDVFAVNLDRALDTLRPYELAEYFKEAAEKARKRRPTGAPVEQSRDSGADRASAPADAGGPETTARAPGPLPDRPLTFDANDAYLRIRRIVATAGSVSALEITPGGDRVMYAAGSDGQRMLFSVDYAGRDRKTIFSGPAWNVRSSLTGERVLFVSGGMTAPEPGTPPEDRPRRGSGGEVYLGRPGGGEADRLSIDATVTVAVAAQQQQKFREATRLIGERFYHPTLKGLNWSALVQRYEPLALAVRTDSEFNRIVMLLLGELDASHLGISGGRSTAGPAQAIGYLGVDVAPVPGGFRITRVVPHSPAAAKSGGLSPGEVIVAINGQPLAPASDAEPLADIRAFLVHAAGEETLLDVQNEQGATRRVVLTPIPQSADAALRYREEVRQRAARVERLSSGRVGYLHIRAMDMASVRDFERDLFAAGGDKEGLIIDVRDNGGGSTTDILLASLTAPRHAYTAARGMDRSTLPPDAYPRDRRLIYAYTRPIVVLINQNSFSNAEIFAHAIRTTGRGPLVGTATFGAVISTGSATLIDGTTLRMPFRGWYLPDGTDMENHGAQPHVPVAQTPADEVAGEDPQLEAAVRELLMRLPLPAHHAGP